MTAAQATIPTVILQGAPFERGRQHGARFRGEIAAAVAAARAEHGPAAHAAGRAHAGAALALLAQRAPRLAAELDGLAAGSEADPTELMLRCGFELLGLPPASGCSAVAVGGPRGALVAQNWDAPPRFAQELALFLHFGPDGFEQAVIGPVGGLCWVGCNSRGLAFVNNDLMLRSSAPGLPSQAVRRLILEKGSVTDALALLRGLPHMGGRSYLLGDASGAVAGVEVSARVGVRVNQTASPVLHANHALDPEIRVDEAESALTATYPSSRHRYAVLRDKLPPAADVAAIAALLADRDGHPNAVAKASSPEEPSATLFSVIFDCAGRCLHLCPANPAGNAYRRLAW